MLAFVIKAPLFPFHGWLPDAYRQAPPEVAAVLSGVIAKAGLYGMLRIAITKASNCRISLWRDVSDFAPSLSPRAPLSASSTTCFVREGVMKVFPFNAAWMATTNSSEADA